MVSWVDNVEDGSDPKGDIFGDLVGRSEKSKHTLLQQKTCTQATPKKRATYFKNVWRRRIGDIIEVSRQWLPAWVILALSFVGSSLVDGLTDERLLLRLVANLKIIAMS